MIDMTLKKARGISYSQLYPNGKDTIGELLKGLPTCDSVCWIAFIIAKKESLKVGEFDLHIIMPILFELNNELLHRVTDFMGAYVNKNDLYINVPALLDVIVKLLEKPNLDKDGISTSKLNVICLNRNEIRDHLFEISDGHLGTIWVKLYKRKTFGNNFKFDTKYTRGHEDINFNYKMMSLANSFVSSNQILYKHIIRGDLSTSAHVHPEAIVGMYDAIINYDIMVKSFFMNDDLLRELKYYVKILMDMIRTLSVYSIKAGYHYQEYAQMLDEVELNVPSLKMVHFRDTNLAEPKDRFIFMLLKQSKFLSFMLIKLVNRIKK